MRRYSQRTQLVTLSDINVTPLLDLAFVLLIIFAITSPLLEQSIHLRLPDGGTVTNPTRAQDVITAEVSASGEYYLQGQKMASLDHLEAVLVQAHQNNPNLVVRIRADATGMFQLPINIVEICRRNGMNKFDLATEPDRTQGVDPRLR